MNPEAVRRARGWASSVRSLKTATGKRGRVCGSRAGTSAGGRICWAGGGRRAVPGRGVPPDLDVPVIRRCERISRGAPRPVRRKTLAAGRRRCAWPVSQCFHLFLSGTGQRRGCFAYVDLARCPWNTAHHPARIGVRGRRDAAVPGAEVLVAFNVRQVSAYRLIGYEGRRPQRRTLSAKRLTPANR